MLCLASVDDQGQIDGDGLAVRLSEPHAASTAMSTRVHTEGRPVDLFKVRIAPPL